MLSQGNHICKGCHKKQVRERRKYVPKGTSTLGKSPVKSGRKTSPLEEEALQMIREGISGAEVAKRIDVSPSTVSNWRKAAGLPGKRGGRAKNQPHHSTKPHNPEVREEALRLFRDGIKIREIEKQLGVSYQTIYAWTRKSDQTTHSQSKSGIRVFKDKDSGMFHVIDKEGTMLGEYARRKTARAQATWISKRQTNKANISQGSTCRVCQIYLDENNSYTSMVSRGNFICKKCHQSQVQQRNSKSSNTTEKHPLRDEAIQMIRDGISGVEVVRRLGVSKNRVIRWRKLSGLSGTTGSPKKHSLLKEEGLQMIQDGVSGAEVARRLGVHKGTVRTWRKAAGLSGTTGSPKYSLLKEEGLQMIQDGVSGAEVARRMGVHQSTVSKWRKSAGLSGVDGRQFHDIEKENEVIDLLREDKSFNQITKSTGVGRNAIIRIKTEAEREGFL